ncbi:hypothetical protein [Methylobacterium flocculans]|uniref:hypothetical protein n=1 Tax=Methylobacterium flocculans TaxID=2984843 RepID=UPI0021F2E9DB|nr:hypothetical protein [Methylobacterium sp. FF17]
MQPFIIHVRVQTDGGTRTDILRYAVLAASSEEALERVSNGLAFGDRALMSDECLDPDKAASLSLAAGTARLIA